MLNMTSDNFVSGNNSFKSHLNAKTVAVVRSTLILLQYKGDCEFSFRRKLKKASFNGDSNEEILNVNKTCCQ